MAGVEARVHEIRISDEWRGAPQGVVRNPTLWLFAVASTGAAANVWANLTGRLPLAASIAIAIVVLYILWYVMHEASHRLVHPQRRMNDAVGWVSAAPLLLAFSCFVERHQQHHAHTNEPSSDPDIAVSRTPWRKRLLGLYFPITYRAACAHGGKRSNRRLRIEQRIHDAIVPVAVIGLGLVGGVGLVALAVVPPLVIGPVITFTFSYLPHRPFRADGRYRDTREQPGRLVTMLLFGQNHHLTHHLWVNVPWYRLPRLAAHVAPDLRSRDCVMGWRQQRS